MVLNLGLKVIHRLYISLFILEISRELTQKHSNKSLCVNGSHFFFVLDNKTGRGGKHAA